MCIGCYGPNTGVPDFGARMMSALASVIDSGDPAEIDQIIQTGIPDPVGSLYRFSLAHSLLRRKLPAGQKGRGARATQRGGKTTEVSHAKNLH